MAERRYLIGGGEKLSEEIPRAPRGTGDKAHPYTFEEAKRRLSPGFRAISSKLRQLPPSAFPKGQAALSVVLHPTYLAKSYYPADLMMELQLSHLGSRSIHIRPDQGASQRDADEARSLPAPLLYLAGPVTRLLRFVDALDEWRPLSEDVRSDFRKIEQISLPGPDRLKPLPKGSPKGSLVPLEVVLHLGDLDERSVLDGFGSYLETLDVEFDLGRHRTVGGLCFMAMHAPKSRLPEVADFAFLRALRHMPRIVPLDPPMRSSLPTFRVRLPDEDAAAPELSCAIFDGGLPENHGLDRWVTSFDAPGVGAAVAGAQAHGLGVTSAFLFGPLKTGEAASRPFGKVDHWRVIGADTAADDFEIYSVLDRIEEVLTSKPYDFINISLGPDCAMDDDDVNAWTSTLDSLLADGNTVATVACGNNGELDQPSGLHRVQPPSDGVNSIGVGSCNSMTTPWRRADYSAWGPGRSPGYVKPDVLCFGGSHEAPFLMLTGTSPAVGGGRIGTSFAAPLGMRSGVGVRAQFREPLWAPTIKALMVHQAQSNEQDKCETGWGRLSHELDDLVLCPDGEAHVVYQRAMPETGTVRLLLPIPPGLPGTFEIKATFSFYCDIDPEDAMNYTKAGLDIQFRPDLSRFGPAYRRDDGSWATPTTPKSDSFFSSNDFYEPEYRRRSDAHKWETTLSQVKRKRSNSLNMPVFDVSRIIREHGHIARVKSQMKFGLVISVKNSSVPDLYDRVVTHFAGRLQPMRPRAEVRLQTRR